MKGITTHTGIVAMAMALAVGMSFAGCEWVFPDLVDGNGPTGDASNTGDGPAVQDGSTPVDGAMTGACDDASADQPTLQNSTALYRTSAMMTVVPLWPVRPNDLVVVAVGLSVSGPPSVTDTNGNVFQMAVGPLNSTNSWNYILYAEGAVGASGEASADDIDMLTVATVASSAPSHINVLVAEFSGVKTSNALDVATGLPTSATAIDGGFLMQTGGRTTSPLELVFGYAAIPSELGIAVTGVDFTLIRASESCVIESHIVTCEGPVQATATCANSAGVPVGDMLMATFRAQ